MTITQPLDLWTIGAHRLFCGDAGNPEHVVALMQSETASLCFSSPPYLNQRDYHGVIGDWDGLMRAVYAQMPLDPDGQILVNLGLVRRKNQILFYWNDFIAWMVEQGYRMVDWYVWDKLCGAPGSFSGRLAPTHEWIFHFNKRNRSVHKIQRKVRSSDTKKRGMSIGFRRSDGTMKLMTAPACGETHKIPDSVIRQYPHRAGGIACEHPAVFSVALCETLLATFTNAGDLVYEPFAGSGTQIIAAERLHRRCYAMEISPAYCDIAIRRIEAETDLIAYNQRGQPFDCRGGLVAAQ